MNIGNDEETESELAECSASVVLFMVVEIKLVSGSGMLVEKAGVPCPDIVIGKAVIVVTNPLPDGESIVWVSVEV